MRILSSPPTNGSLFSRTASRCILASLVCYILLVQYCRIRSHRDPTSAFFDARKGYQPIYSGFRASKGANFIRYIDAVASSTTNATNATTALKPPGNRNASLCVGIASIARKDVSYIEATVGSLLMDLGPREREDLYLILFIPHVDPTIHPSFESKWLSAMADRVLLYNVTSAELDHLRELEKEGGLFREKGLFDYVYLLKACQEIGAPHTIMVEDDVLAMDGWYHRTKRALVDADQQTSRLGASQYLYLRLFYTQGLLGWNSEEWFIYLLCSVAVIAALWGTLVTTRRYVPRSNSLLTNKAVLVICFIYGPLCIVLFFASGRLSMLPIPSGVHQMPRFGCCSQALVFPHNRVPDVVFWYEKKKIGFADSLLEEYANINNEIRWALTPSVFQHIGAKSSKDGSGDDVAKQIWNPDFELNDPIALQAEHNEAAKPAKSMQ
ncbi:hypothetical protein H112_00637 [Trichophyton rubrum D6]|uniref:Integral membrane protein n=2 Tax=Trichophyton rubrum TaxID=5551 RepID=F2SYY9_TRIRC|nr:uncharacterized protein TERG_07760 [Trichophyton rubrum CBS 118892]EZF27341.1 hypothetical protein H100_00637 [Trichophyton rubrum MR850]EZF46383.1 hypothetical protein H102_00634 [Trichophyton rubrum CBS 100081]EZF57075.1 hypothetical protein H103_00636 [Trichophyton rubrum CBS 288.86]EZF67638.1 hypothetical protein H104_00623 [Trichophyton rubrum CBS 289.86]EZF88938.1 hypothetical protein H110_00641 [Trichophyton rubrum MR1448]EZF99744.1 hypothetical protein H113_00640 [Trichophyton rubr